MQSKDPSSVIMVAVAFTLATSISSISNEFSADSDINRYVQEALHDDARVDASGIQIEVKKGIVTLAGTVDNLAARQYAALEALKIKGVLGVVNQVSVSPSHRSDADVAEEVRRRIARSPVVDLQGLQVEAVDGQVTLAGRVTSQDELNEAELLAGEVRGVRRVRNRLLVDHPPAWTDQDIRNDVISRLGRDVYFASHPIRVTVEGGAVTLDGSVGSAFEQDRAAHEIRWLPHVKQVKNNLKIEVREYHGARESESAPSDEELKGAVRAELDQDSRLDASDVSIEVSRGAVTLNGVVPTREQKILAEQDVHDVVGVSWIANHLFVNTDQRPDSVIQADVDHALSADELLNDTEILVEVKDGMVTLSGDAHAWDLQKHAEAVAKKVPGVRSVNNNLNLPQPEKDHE